MALFQGMTSRPPPPLSLIPLSWKMRDVLIIMRKIFRKFFDFYFSSHEKFIENLCNNVTSYNFYILLNRFSFFKENHHLAIQILWLIVIVFFQKADVLTEKRVPDYSWIKWNPNCNITFQIKSQTIRKSELDSRQIGKV